MHCEVFDFNKSMQTVNFNFVLYDFIILHHIYIKPVSIIRFNQPLLSHLISSENFKAKSNYKLLPPYFFNVNIIIIMCETNQVRLGHVLVVG